MNNKLIKGMLMIIIIIQVIALGIIPKERVYASEDIREIITESYVNDEYSNIRNNSIYNFVFKEYNYVTSGEDVVCNNLDEAAEYLRKEMVKRKDEIVFTVKHGYYSEISRDIFTRAMKDCENLNSSEGDYLMKHFTKYTCPILDSVDECKLIYEIEYLSTASQEQQVDNEVKEVLKNLGIKNECGISNMSEYDKAKIIHDYIVKNIFYDYDYKNYSAYNAIIDKSVVCQGFASLTYKMFKEAGIMTRIITGCDKKGNSHAWNIARIDGKWFNLDNTWDENSSSGDKVNLSYDYFLKSEKDFSGHYKDDEYMEYEFVRNHPMSNESYASKEDVNCDGVIDTEDLAILASVYNIDSSSSRWNNRYDIIKDNIIDIYDIVALSSKISA